MGAKSRTKGKVAEREVVSILAEAGFLGERNWISAQSPVPEERAVDVLIRGHNRLKLLGFQVKRKAKGFKFLYDALKFVDGLWLRQDDEEWIVVLPAKEYVKLLQFAPSANDGKIEKGNIENENQG